LDSAGTALEGTDYWTPAIQGNYSVFLQGGSIYYPGGTNGASIGQTGQIPATAQSIIFWGNALQVTFNGQILSFIDISNALNYTIWRADISAYAGQTGELLFTAHWFNGQGMIDNIQFSTLPIPEPSVLGLFSMCTAILCWHMKRPKSRQSSKALPFI
jgi:hypothetical protein